MVIKMQRQIYPLDIKKHEEKLKVICEKLGLSKANAIRNAIDYYYEHIRGLEVIELREISKEEAEKEILAYIKEKGKAWTDEIADNLRLDVLLVNDILMELAEKGVVE